jgi:type I restriction enzyme S subunit
MIPPLAEQRMLVAALEEQLSRLDDAVRLIASGINRLPLIRRAVLDQVMPDPLPAGWKLLTVEEAGTVELGRQRSPKYHSGPNMKPYLRVANVHEDRIDLSDVKEMDFPPEQLARHELHPGDILLNEGNGSPELVGSPAMYRGELPGACFTNSLIRFRPFDSVDGEYALLVFLRHLDSGRFQSAAQITTIAHMAAGRFKRVEFPVPPPDEQRAIVLEVRRQLSLLGAFETALRVALKRSEALRRSILAAAFRGELVPQDPADEPASGLLARIAAARPTPARRTRRKNGA